METRQVGEVAGEFTGEVEEFIASLGVNREEFTVRANRCEGRQGELSQDVFHIWIGLKGFDPGAKVDGVIDAAHARLKDADWTITRYRRLDDGGVNLSATNPVTGDKYSLDSGFDVSPDSYLVGFFNTPCFHNPTGEVDFGTITPTPTLG